MLRRLVALDIKLEQAAVVAGFLLGEQGGAAAEVLLPEIENPAQAQLQRRMVAAAFNRVQRAVEIHIRGEKARFHPRHLKRLVAHRLDAVHASPGEQFVPQQFGVPRLHPQLVTEVAGVAGAGDQQLARAEGEAHDLERFALVDAGKPQCLQQGAGGRSLQRQRGEVLADIRDRHRVEAHGSQAEPVIAGVGAAQHELLRAQPEQGAVVHHLAGVGTPDIIGHGVHRLRHDIPGDHAVQHRRRVGTGKAVLAHGGGIEHAAGVAGGKVFQLRVGVVHGRGEAVPLAPLLVEVEA